MPSFSSSGPKLLAAQDRTAAAPTWPTTLEALKAQGLEPFTAALREVANRNGLKLWLENYGHWGFPSESLLYGKNSDLVGGEFWYGNDRLDALECRLAASTVHVYGKKICYAEAFTSYNDLNMTPAQVKTRGDQIFAEGVNHYVFHVSVHQPDFDPGIISPWFGMPLHRKNAWFSEAKSWVDYVRRCQYLLQQGRYVADVAYFMGEDTPMMAGSREPTIPPGYAYDFVSVGLICRRRRCFPMDGRRRFWKGWPGLLSRGLPSTTKSLVRPFRNHASCWTLDRLLIWCG